MTTSDRLAEALKWQIESCCGFDRGPGDAPCQPCMHGLVVLAAYDAARAVREAEREVLDVVGVWYEAKVRNVVALLNNAYAKLLAARKAKEGKP